MRSVIRIVSFIAVVLLFATFASSFAEEDIHPVVDLQQGYLLGGSKNGKWLTAEAAAGLLKGREKYRVYSLNQYLEQGTGNKPASQGAPCPETSYVTVSSGTGKPLKKAGQIAVGGAWNALPRVPRIASTTQPVYLMIVGDILRRNGIAKPKVRIKQVLRADLDSDGTDEVLIAADSFANAPQAEDENSVMPSATQAGDYSLLFLRKETKGKVKTIFLSQHYYRKSESFSAPSRSGVTALLDLNGDGKMEIIVRERYYEGVSTIVYGLVGNSVKEVLSSGCGA